MSGCKSGSCLSQRGGRKEGKEQPVVVVRDRRVEYNMGLMNGGQPQIAFRLFDHHFESYERHINAKRFTFILDMIDVPICKY